MSRKAENASYQGQFAGTTRAKRAVTTPRGETIEAEMVVCINAETDPELIERLESGDLNPVPIPVMVHAPTVPMLVLVVPRAEEARQIDLRLEILEALQAEATQPPSYVLDFRTVVAPFGPRELRREGRAQRVLAQLTAEEEGGDSTAVDIISPYALGGGTVRYDGSRVAVHLMGSSARLGPFVAREPELLMQLHCLPSYPIISLMLVARDDTGRILDELFGMIDIDAPEHLTILSQLQKRFAVDAFLYEDDGRRVATYRVELPLASNVAFILDRAAAWLDGIPENDRDFTLAARYIASDGYERIGAQRHNFHRDSFVEIGSVGAARIAVSIVGYWSEQQNFEYLILNRSFPLEFFRAIQARAVEAAMRYGIALRRELRTRAVQLGFARTQAELVGKLVARFADVVSSDAEHKQIDTMAQSENWDQLLTTCVDLGVPVEDAIRDLADSARRQARKGATTPGVHIDDITDTRDFHRVGSVADAPTAALRDLLEKEGLAPEASRELLGRGGETNILYVIEGAHLMAEADVHTTARVLAAGAEQFEPALLVGLGRSKRNTVHLCALALAMARRMEALPTLIELMHDSERSDGIPIREIVARYGEQAVPTLFEAIETRGATDALVEVLALISIDYAPAIISALREHNSGALLEAAQRLSEMRRELGGREMRGEDEFAQSRKKEA